MQTTVPPEVANALKNGEPAPPGLSAEETIAYEAFKNFATSGSGFRAIMGTRPQTIGYSLADSPVGLAAWFYEKFAEWTDTDGEPERALTKDEMLDDITLYWLTNTAASSARLYWENNAHKTKIGREVSIPAAVSRFPREIIPLPRSWAERAYPKLIYFNNSTGAVTSPPGNNRNSLRARCERRSGRCADRCTSASVRSHRRVKQPPQ